MLMASGRAGSPHGDVRDHSGYQGLQYRGPVVAQLDGCVSHDETWVSNMTAGTKLSDSSIPNAE